MTPQLSSANGTPVTVRHVCERFMFHCWKRYSRDALKERQRTLTTFCAELGSKLVSECTPMMLLDFLASHPEWRKPSTIKGVASIIGAVFNWGARMKLIADNPFKGLPPLERGEPRRSMTPAEFRALCRTTDKRFRRWLRFLWLTGCRPGEASKLTWPMIDWERGQAVLREHKTAKKTGKARQIPIPSRMLRLLRAMHARDTKDNRSADFVFRTSRESPWTRWYTSTKMQRLRPRAGVASDCVPYCARHAFGTAGCAIMPIKLVSVALGHASVTTTEKNYVHLENHTQELRGVSEAIESARRSTFLSRLPSKSEESS